MGQKINPKSYRMAVIYKWNSKWFSKKDYVKYLKEDVNIREFLTDKLKDALLDRIEIERASDKLIITIYSAKPGLIIGRAGAGIEALKKELYTKVLKRREKVEINIMEVDKPMLSASIVARGMAFDIEKRIPFRRVMKQAISRVKKEGALGIRIVVAGRLNGAEIARTEMLNWGKMPLHTLRADIDYNMCVANTTYGSIGIKVWIYKGDVFNKK
jgi:small subunit ribosomal protein S3